LSPFTWFSTFAVIFAPSTAGAPTVTVPLSSIRRTLSNSIFEPSFSSKR